VKSTLSIGGLKSDNFSVKNVEILKNIQKTLEEIQ
jgi:hypothetical protein